MKVSTRPLIAGALALGVPLAAQAEAPIDFSAFDLSANATLTSDYLFRGVSQTSNGPAIQGGFDVGYETGGWADLYVGTWASNIDFEGGASKPATVEIDVYGGLTGELWDTGISWDVGGIYYAYPAQNEEKLDGVKFDYVEAYLELGYDLAPVKFGTLDVEPSIGAGYYVSPDFFGEDGTAHYGFGTLDLGLPYAFNLGFLVGYQDVKGRKLTPGGFNYGHYSIALSKDISIFNIGVSWNDGFDNKGDIVPRKLLENIVLGWISASF